MSGPRRGHSLAEVMAPMEGEPVARATETAPGEGGHVETARDPRAAAPAIVPVNVLVAPEDRRRLRQLSLDANLSLQKLGHEAWNLLLQKRGLPPLKPVSASVPSGRATGRTRR